MDDKEILKSLRINYIFSVLAALMVIVVFETGVVAKDALDSLLSSSWTYILQVTAVMVTVLFIPLAIKGFTSSLSKALGCSDDEFRKLFAKKSIQRIFLIFIALLLNIFIYYGIGYNGSLYCSLFAFGALLYSYPTRMVLNDYLEQNSQAAKEKK